MRNYYLLLFFWCLHILSTPKLHHKIFPKTIIVRRSLIKKIVIVKFLSNTYGTRKMFVKRKSNFKFIIITLLIVIIEIVLGYYFRPISEKISGSKNRIRISAGIVPHHLLAKNIIENFFRYISSKDEPEVIVLLSPDHFKVGSIVGDFFITLEPQTLEFYGMKIDRPLIKNLYFENNIFFSNSSIKLDHGIINLMPFIKKYFPNSKVVPFIIPSSISKKAVDQFVISLNRFAPKKTIVIASVDFSHYLPVPAARFHDVKSIRTIINFEKENFEKLDVDSWQALYIARAFAHKMKMESPKLIAYANSHDITKNSISKEVTSYFSVVFEKETQNKERANRFEGKTILFVGNIILDKSIKHMTQKNSVFYPFEKIKQFLKGIDLLVGNLEGVIVENPEKFDNHSLKYVLPPEIVKAFSHTNFNLFSLSNKHAFDMGETGLEQTKKFLTKANINFVGHPNECNKNSKFEKNEIIILSFKKTSFSNCSDKEIINHIKTVRALNIKKFIIVLLHWDEEYQSKNFLLQQKLAHQIIDSGADLIISFGIPIVQKIEEYKRKLIFYSLGNFIFGQHFSKETSQTLAIGLEIYSQEVIFRLFPIKNQLGQPFLMDRKEANLFLEKLAEKSSNSLSDKIKSGIIVIKR